MFATEKDDDGDEVERMFTDYGELVLLIDASKEALHEPIKDASTQQKRKIIKTLEGRINDTPLQGNEEMMQRFLYLWLFTARELDEGEVTDDEVETFNLNFEEWELQQFH